MRLAVNQCHIGYVSSILTLGAVETKFCKKCCRDVPLNNWHKLSRSSDGLQWSCKDCCKAYSYAWKEKNLEKEREYKRKWNEENAEKERLRRAKHYRENRDSVLAINAEWSRNNRDKRRMHTHNRRARKQAASGYATHEQVQARIDYYGRKCIYCGGPYESIEHLFPLSKGGTNWPANLAPSCLSCNSTKAAKTVWEFFDQIHK